MKDPKVTLDLWKQRVGQTTEEPVQEKIPVTKQEKPGMERRVEVLEINDNSVRLALYGNSVRAGIILHLNELEDKYQSLKKDYDVLYARFEKLLAMMEVEVDMDAK